MKQRITECSSFPVTILRTLVMVTILAIISSVNASDTSPGSGSLAHSGGSENGGDTKGAENEKVDDEEGSRGGVTASRSGGRSGGRFGGLRNVLDDLPMELDMKRIREDISSGEAKTPVTADTDAKDDSIVSTPGDDKNDEKNDGKDDEKIADKHDDKDDDKKDGKDDEKIEDKHDDKDDGKNDGKDDEKIEDKHDDKDDGKNDGKDDEKIAEKHDDKDDDKKDGKDDEKIEDKHDDKDDGKNDGKDDEKIEDKHDDKDDGKNDGKDDEKIADKHDDKKDGKDDEKIEDKDDGSADEEKDQVVEGGDSGDEKKNDSPHDDGVPATKNDEEHKSADGNPGSSESEDHTPPAENTKEQLEKFFRYHLVKDSSNKNMEYPKDVAVQALDEDENVFYVTFACQPIIGKYVCKLQCAKRGAEMAGTCETGYCHCLLRKEKKLRKEIHKRLVAAMEGFDTDCSDPKKAKQCKRFCKGLTPDKEYTGLCTDKRCNCVKSPSEAEKKNPCKKAIKNLKRMEEQALKIRGVKPESGTGEQQVSVTDEDIKRFSSLETLEGCTEDDIKTLRSIVGYLSQGFNLAKPSEGTQNPSPPRDLSGSSTSTSSPETPTKGQSGSFFWNWKSW